MKKIILIATLIMSSICHARLGDTREQCEKRYGTIIEKWHDDSWVRFAKGCLRVECLFKEDKCVVVAYHLASASMAEIIDYNLRFSEQAEDLLLILNQNTSRYLPWKCTTMRDLGNAMKTEDGKRRVFINQTEIRFEDCDYIEWRTAMTSKENIEGIVKEVSK